MAFTPVDYIASYFGWTQFTPVIPKMYWDVYSAEERVKKICFELHKLCEYANMLADSINLDRTAIKEIEAALANIENLDEIDEQIAALQEQVEEIQELLESLPNYEEFATMRTELNEKLFVFDTVADMQNCSYLNVGEYCATEHFRNTDNGSAIYIITDDQIANGMDKLQCGDYVAVLTSTERVNPQMLGSFGDNEHDDTEIIARCFEISKSITLDKDYKISVSSGANTCFSVPSNTHIQIDGTINLATNSLGVYNIFLLSNKTNISISGNGTVSGDKTTHTGETGEYGHLITVYGCSNVTVSGITLMDAWGDCIYVGNGCENVIIDNVIIDNARRNGISITSCDKFTLSNSVIKNTRGTAPQLGIDIEGNNDGYALDNIFIDNVELINNVSGLAILNNYKDNLHFTASNIICHNNSFILSNGGGEHCSFVASNVVLHNSIFGANNADENSSISFYNVTIYNDVVKDAFFNCSISSIYNILVDGMNCSGTPPTDLLLWSASPKTVSKNVVFKNVILNLNAAPKQLYGRLPCDLTHRMIFDIVNEVEKTFGDSSAGDSFAVGKTVYRNQATVLINLYLARYIDGSEITCINEGSTLNLRLASGIHMYNNGTEVTVITLPRGSIIKLRYDTLLTGYYVTMLSIPQA